MEQALRASQQISRDELTALGNRGAQEVKA